MRLGPGRGTHRLSVKTFSSKVWVWVFVLAAACSERTGELREWKPEDHQPPPAVAPEGQGEGAGPGAAAPGAAVAALWSLRCATCHGPEGRGDGPQRPPGSAVPDMTQAAFQGQRSDAQLIETITHGRGMMPAFGQELTEAGAAALVQHIRQLGAP
jgi:mono/diheme cytochrome c family protein